LVPVTDAKDSKGGHLPDFKRIEQSDVAPEYVANLKNLQDNIAYYSRERIIRKAIAYGEAAAFVRVLKAKGVKLDLAPLLANLSSVKPAVASSAATGSESCALAAVHWTSAESIGTRVAFEDHLTRFPTCSFATLAKSRVESLKK
jgi:hypothetical protein